MADGVLGEDILLVLEAVEQGFKQEHVVALILLHLLKEINARDHQPNQGIAIPMHAQVCILQLEFLSTQEKSFIII